MGIRWGCPQYFKIFIMADFTGYDTGQRTRMSKRGEPSRSLPNYNLTERGQAPQILQGVAAAAPPPSIQGASPTGEPVNRTATQGYEGVKQGVAAAVPIAGAFKAVGDSAESAGVDESLMDPFGNKVTKLEEGDTDAVLASIAGGPIGGFLHNKEKI